MNVELTSTWLNTKIRTILSKNKTLPASVTTLIRWRILPRYLGLFPKKFVKWRALACTRKSLILMCHSVELTYNNAMLLNYTVNCLLLMSCISDSHPDYLHLFLLNSLADDAFVFTKRNTVWVKNYAYPSEVCP